MSKYSPHYRARVKKELKDGVAKFTPMELDVIWGNDFRYWSMPKGTPGAPAELLQVCWLEVSSSVIVNPNKTYKVSFLVSLTPDAFGWKGSHLHVMAKIGKQGKYKLKKVDLTSQPREGNPFHIPDNEFRIGPQSSESESILYFGLYEVWSGKWKGGLKIHEATVEEVP